MRSTLFIAMILLVPAAVAQQVGNCELGEAEAILDGNNVRALILNTGGLFWKGDNRLYEVPAGSGIQAIFAMDLVIGGIVDDELRFAGAAGSFGEFWPGPLDEDGNPPADCTVYDRIWNVSLEDVARYNTTGETTSDLLDWPIELGAPVLDGDGVEGNYNLDAGDRPALIGSETAFWVMNDLGNDHRWGGTDPIGLEIRATASAFSRVYVLDRLGSTFPFEEDLAGVLDHTTLYRYELIYRGESPLDSAFVGLWVFAQLGNGSDNYLGSLPDLGVGFLYNGDNDDEERVLSSGEVLPGYGSSPPALGIAFTGGPADRAMHTFLTWVSNSNPVNGNPSDAGDAYSYLRGEWRNGDRITYGGDGTDQSNQPTMYMYPELPPNFWREEHRYPAGGRNNPGERFFLMSHGPFRLEPGESTTIDFAIVWTRGVNRHASVAKLQLDVPLLQAAPLEPDSRLRTITLEEFEEMEQAPEPDGTLPDFYRFSATPNPAEGPILIRYDLPEPVAVRIALYDVLGRELRVIEEGEQSAGTYTTQLDGSGLPSGTYLIHLQFGNLSATKPITIFR